MLVGLFLPRTPAGSRLATTIAWRSVAAFGATGVTGILGGIAALQRKPWARSFIASVSSVWVAFSGLMLICCVSVWRDQLTTRSVTYLFHMVLPVLSGAYFAAGLWWLVTFTREDVIAEFASPNQQAGYRTYHWKGRLPLAVLAEYFVLIGILALVTAPVTGRVPYFIFGFPLFGLAWKIFILLWGILYLSLGAAILLRKPRSLDIAIAATILFALASSVTLVDSHSTNRMKEALAVMASRGYPPPLHDPSATLRYREKVTIGTQVLALAILLGWRRGFFDSVRTAIPPTTFDAVPEELLP